MIIVLVFFCVLNLDLLLPLTWGYKKSIVHNSLFKKDDISIRNSKKKKKEKNLRFLGEPSKKKITFLADLSAKKMKVFVEGGKSLKFYEK